MFEISEGLAQFGGNCPICGKYFLPSGVGPEDVPALNTALNNLPSSHILRYGANYHDFAYHMGSLWGTRLQADRLMLSKNKQKIKSLKMGWLKSMFYYTMNQRNYYAVRMFGGKFWNSKGCKEV